MKKLTGLLCIVLIAMCSCSSGKMKNNLQIENLKGRVSKTTEVWSSEFLKKPIQKIITKYNPQGYETEYSLNDRDGLMTTYNICRCNEKGLPIETSNFEHGKLESTLKYNFDGSISEFSSFDENGKLTKNQIYRRSKTEISTYDFSGKLISTQKQKYKKGKIIESLVIAGSEVGAKTIWKYDDRGNIIEYYRLAGDGNLLYKQTYKFDDRGDQIEDCLYDTDGSVSLKKNYNYVDYDSMGNWIKKIELTDNEIDYTYERTIEYYLK